MVNRNFIQVYDAKKHSYGVVLKTKYGKFIGTATCSKEDWGHESDFFGYTIAESRARIEELKYHLQKAKIEYKYALNFYKSLKCYTDFNDESTEAKLVKRQVFVKERQVKDLKDTIKASEEAIKDYINETLKAFSDLDKKKAEESSRLKNALAQDTSDILVPDKTIILPE